MLFAVPLIIANFGSEIISFYTTNFKPCKKDACDIPLPSSGGSQLDSAVIKKANKQVSKLILDKQQVGSICRT